MKISAAGDHRGACAEQTHRTDRNRPDCRVLPVSRRRRFFLQLFAGQAKVDALADTESVSSKEGAL